MLLGHMGVAFIERRLSLLILFFIFHYDSDFPEKAIFSHAIKPVFTDKHNTKYQISLSVKVK
jgi:hypothetical protein